MKVKSIRKLILPVILIAGLIAFFASGAHRYVTFAGIAENYGLLKSYADANLALSYVIFTLLYCMAVAFSLPIALPLTLTGGAVLGWPAILLIVTGATLGASIVFVAARSILGDFLRAKAGPFIGGLEAGFSNNAFSYLLALRLIPAVPFWVVNIVPALTSMRLSSYVAATFIGIIPGTAVFVSVGRGFDHILAAGQTPDLSVLGSPSILIPLAGLGALALLPIVHKRWKASQEAAHHSTPQHTGQKSGPKSGPKSDN